VSENENFHCAGPSMNIDDWPSDWPVTDWSQGPFAHFYKISNGHITAMRHPIHFMLVFDKDGSNSAISSSLKSKMVVCGHLQKIQMATSLKCIIRFT